MAKKQKMNNDVSVDVLKSLYCLPAKQRRGLVVPTNTSKVIDKIKEPMKNPKIKYARDRYGRYHDKSCEKLQYYSADTITYLPAAGANVEFHAACYRRAMIRSGIDTSEQKNIDKYFKYFERVNPYPQTLKDLFLIRGAKMHLINRDMLEITLDEDRWKVEFDYLLNRYVLWHNSYYIVNEERVFTGDFHVQDVKLDDTWSHIVYNILHYKWTYRNHYAMQSYDDWV